MIETLISKKSYNQYKFKGKSNTDNLVNSGKSKHNTI